MADLLSKAALPAAKQAWSAVRLELARNGAAQAASSDPAALIGPYIDEALTVLAQDAPSLPGRLASELKAWLSEAPPMFSAGAPRVWIRTDAARNRLKALALELIGGGDVALTPDDVAFYAECAAEAHPDPAADRSAEAVAAFDEALAFLRASILRHLDASNKVLLALLQPTLDGIRAAVADARPAQGVARYLSPRAAHRIPSFTGRETQLRRLRDGERPAVLAGMPGVGKSSVAREFGRRHAGAYRHVLVLDASERETLVRSLVAFARATAPALVDDADPHLTADRIRATLGTGETNDLVIFDDVRDERLLAEWLPGAGVRTIATTRQSAWSDAFDVIEVGRWDRPDSIAFLQAESGRSDVDAARWNDLAGQLGDLPLALSHAAAYLRYNRLADVSAYSAALDRHMEAAPPGTDTPRSVFATFRQAIGAAEALLPGAAEVAAVCAYTLPVAVPLELLEGGTLPGGGWMDRPAVQERVALLAHLSLVALDVGDRSLAIHQLVQRTARADDDGRAWVLAVRLAERALPPYAFERFAAFARLALHGEAILLDRRDWPGGRELGDLAFKIGGWRGEAGPFDLAERHLSDAVDLRRAALGDDHPHVAAALVNLAQVLEHLDAFDRAETCLREAIAIDDVRYGRRHFETAVDIQKLAELECRLSRFAEAESHAREALDIMTAVSGADSKDVISPLQALGSVLSQAGRPEDGLLLAQRALVLTRRHGTAAGLEGAIALTCVAGDLEDLGRLGEAEHLWREALGIYQRLLEPHHPRLAQGKTALGLCLMKQRRFRRAKPLLRDALESGERQLGPSHSEVAVLLENMAELLAHGGNDLEEAEALGRRALRIVARTLAPDHWRMAQSSSNLGLTLMARGAVAEAADLFRSALAIDEGCFGPDNPNTIIRVENLASAYARLGRRDEAAILYDRAAQAHVKRNGTEDSRAFELRRRAAELRVSA